MRHRHCLALEAGSTPGAGPDYDVLDPVTFRFTGVSIACTAATCGNLNLPAAFSFVATNSGFFNVGIGLEGFSTANVCGLITGVIGNGSSALAIERGQTIRGYLMIRVDSMSRGTLRFPNSVAMSLVDVPEPASLPFLAMGLAALAVARVSRNGVTPFCERTIDDREWPTRPAANHEHRRTTSNFRLA